ncbi:MAG: hypothetical protein GF308_15910 [Candidatus Heimdallarchaeota archaeon]|nr:hypothetical protein [Candidatus Heimdallarchaeota archaeon]
MNALRDIFSRMNQKKISIALLGLPNVNFMTLIQKLISIDEAVQATLSQELAPKYYMQNNLSLVAWPLENKIPSLNPLWERSVLGADALFYLFDTNEKESLTMNRQLLEKLVDSSSNQPLLIIGLFPSLDLSFSLRELKTSLGFDILTHKNNPPEVITCSPSTGEGVFKISSWLKKTLLNEEGTVSNYIQIRVAILLNSKGKVLSEVVLSSSVNISLLTGFQELQRKAKIFTKKMSRHPSGEEVLELSEYKFVLVKSGSMILALLINLQDSILRAFMIAYDILKALHSENNQPVDLEDLIKRLYPLDAPSS